MFLHNFMFLIDLLEKSVPAKSEILHIHAYLCLCLRNAVTLFSRVNITDQQLQEWETIAMIIIEDIGYFYLLTRLFGR